MTTSAPDPSDDTVPRTHVPVVQDPARVSFGGFQGQLRLFLTALGFFTRVPIPQWVGYSPEQLNAATRYFPLVGVFVGALVATLTVAMGYVWSPHLAIALGLGVSVLLTGAFHEDGLADSVDAFGGAFERERVLEIMHDSRIGTYGAVALWLALAVTASLCLLRQALSRLPQVLGAVAAIVLATLIAVICAGIVHALYAVLGDNFARGISFWRFTLGSAATTALIAALALRYFYVSDRWAAQVQANARAQADALQARIRPHFLFNSMNLIASLLHRDPAVAERAVLDLSDLFRAALGAGEGDSTLRDECELAERYLSIESLRLGERLQVRWQRDEPLPWDLPLPRLVLQPLVENAVLHGISRLPEGGTIELQLVREGSELQIRVRNPAPDPQAPGLALARGAGHAQHSIGHRLAWRFGSAARMTAGWSEGYYACQVTVPIQ